MKRFHLFLLKDWFFIALSVFGIFQAIYTWYNLNGSIVQFQSLFALFLIFISASTIIDEVCFLLFALYRYPTWFNGVWGVLNYFVAWAFNLAAFIYFVFILTEFDDVWLTDAAWNMKDGLLWSWLMLGTYILFALKYFSILYYLIAKIPRALLSIYFHSDVQNRFNFMTYNISHGKDNYGDVVYQKQFAYIEKHNPDVLFLNSADGPDYSLLNLENSTKVPASGPDRHTQIITKGEVLEEHKIYFENQDAENGRSEYLLFAKLKLKGHTFWAIATHLSESKWMEAQGSQIFELVDKIKEKVGDEPFVLGGGLNLLDFSHGIRYLSYLYVDTWGSVSADPIGATYFLGDTVIPNLPYYARLDYILVSHDSHTALSYSRLGHTGLSDHKPVISHILVSNKEQLEGVSIEQTQLNTSENPILKD